MNEEFDPKAAAEAASEPGTFSFIDRLLGRSFPTHDVKIYLDEQAGFERTRLAAKAANTKVKDIKQAEEIEERIAELDRELAKSRYVITLQGISPERYDALIDEARESYPEEFEESINPFSGEKTKTTIPNEQFDDLLWAKLWSESIKKIVAPDGSVDEGGIDVGTAAHMRNAFPIDGRRKIDVTISELRMGGLWMDAVQDEGFLATP